METTTKIEEINKVIEGLNEIKKAINAAGNNKYASSVLKTVNREILKADWEKTRLLLG